MCWEEDDVQDDDYNVLGRRRRLSRVHNVLGRRLRLSRVHNVLGRRRRLSRVHNVVGKKNRDTSIHIRLLYKLKACNIGREIILSLSLA